MRPTHIFSGIGSRHTLFFLSFFFVAVFTPMTAPLTQQTKVSHPQPPHTEPSQLNMTAKSCLKFSLITSSSQFISSGGKEPAKKREKIRKNQIYFFSFLEKRDIFFLFFKKRYIFLLFLEQSYVFLLFFRKKKDIFFVSCEGNLTMQTFEPPTSKNGAICSNSNRRISSTFQILHIRNVEEICYLKSWNVLGTCLGTWYFFDVPEKVRF